MAHRLRVLVVGNYPLSRERIVGGVQAVTKVFCEAMAESPEVAEVVVMALVTHIQQPEWFSINAKLRVCWVPVPERLNLLTGAGVSVRLGRQVLRSFKPHIIHGQGVGLHGLVASALGGKTVLTIHGVAPREAGMLHAGMAGLIRKILVKARVRHALFKAQAAISTSRYDARAFQAILPNRHVIIPNPIEPVFFQEATSLPEDGYLLYAGAWETRKNILGLLRAFERVRSCIPDAELRVVGPTTEPGYDIRMRELVDRLGLADAVDFIGHVTTSDLVNLMQRGRALVLFSNEETSPTVVAQAMAVGKPVVATKVGGVPEMLRDGWNGYLVSAGDVSSLSNRLIDLLGDPIRCRVMGDRSLAIAHDRFRPAVVAARTLVVYRDVLSANASPRREVGADLGQGGD